jgi:hypothetical protein
MNRPAASEPDRPTYPQYREQFGEDPARFLCGDMDPMPRIRGLEDPELIQAYLDVETDRDDPRKHVIAALDKRRQSNREEVAADGGQTDV